MTSDAKSLIQFIDEQVLVDETSWGIQQVVSSLPENTEEASGAFCDRYELGNWFYEALTLNDIDISAELINIGAKKERKQQEEYHDRTRHQQEYERTQYSNS